MGSVQQAWAMKGFQLGAEQRVWVSQGQNMTEVLGSPGTRHVEKLCNCFSEELKTPQSEFMYIYQCVQLCCCERHFNGTHQSFACVVVLKSGN